MSASSCAEFEQSCEEIATCVRDEIHLRKNSLKAGTLKFEMDEECYSPLPLSSDRPLQHFLSYRHLIRLKDHPKNYGEAISHIMPLEEASFEPIFIPFSYATTKFEQYELESKFNRKFFFERFLEDCKVAYQFFHGDFLEGFAMDKVDYLICSLPFGSIKSPANPTIQLGCSHIKNVCENMKKCYIKFRKYFNFSLDFEQSMVSSGIITVVFMSAAISLSISEFCGVLKVKRFWSEQVTEMLMIVFLILASLDLIGFQFTLRHLNK